MELSRLTITQEKLRNPGQLYEMTQFVKNGGYFNGIEIAYCNDIDRYFIHNGHHRCVSMYFGGRLQLRDSEFIVKQWNKSNYDEINFDVGYVTPFDIETEIRVGDLTDFKKFAFNMASHFDTYLSSISPAVSMTEIQVKNVIRQAKAWYASPRTLHGTPRSLADQYWKYAQ